MLVFDHAFNDGGEARKKVNDKLELLCEDCKPELFGAAVIVREHRCTCFIWLSTERKEAEKVTQQLRANLNVPSDRLVPLP